MNHIMAFANRFRLRRRTEKPEGGMDLEPGSWLDDRYKILRFLGKGREGSVYLAFQEKLFRFYAVKELKKEEVCFSRESIEVWKTLKCEGLPEIVDILEDTEKVWIVSEYIEGENLTEYMRKRRPLSVQQAASWCLQVERVLNWLHSQDPPVCYGDLKPDNLIVQGGRIVMVDMGSLIRKGSMGKRTGTREFSRQQCRAEEADDDYSFGKLTEILAEYCQSRQLKKLADRIRQQEKGDRLRKRRKVRRTLKWIQRQIWIQGGLFAGAIGLLLGSGLLGSERVMQNRRKEAYEAELSSIRILEGKQKRDALKTLTGMYPERAEGYLELLHMYQEDARLDEQEEQEYRKLWKEIPDGWNVTREEILKKNPEDYQRVAYESGLTYWYYDRSIQAKQYAAAWFHKITQMPEEVCASSSLYKKSFLYEKLGEEREKWKKYDETGENNGLFTAYWKNQSELLETDTGQTDMTRLMLWREILSVWKHYMVELREAGVKSEEEEEILKKMEKELTLVPEQHKRMKELQMQLQKDEQEVRQMIQRVYQIEEGEGR